MTLKPNETMRDLPGEGEKILWTVFHVMVALCSLIGDSVILIGTVRYNAIKLHRVIVVVIQHLAVSDLLMTIFRVIPLTVSLIGDGWILGPFLCRMNLILVFFVTPPQAMLTCVLSTFKLMILQRPLRTEAWSRKTAHVVCGVFWVLCLLLPPQLLNMFLTTEESIYFDYIHYVCFCNYSLTSASPWMIQVAHIFIVVSFFGMVVILITTSVILLYKARQAAVSRGKTVRWQGILTVTLTTGIFLASYLPDIIISTGIELTSLQLSSSVKRAASFAENINVVANFFTYTLTVKSFRDFLSDKIRQMGLSAPPIPGRQVRQDLGAQGAMLSRPTARESTIC